MGGVRVVVVVIGLVACGSRVPPPKQPVAEVPVAEAPEAEVPAVVAPEPPAPSTVATPSEAAPEPTCANVAARFVENIRANRARVGKAEPSDMDQMADDWSRACTEGGWTVESRACFVGAAASSDAARCFVQLTNAQRAAFMAVLPSPPGPRNVPPILLEGWRIRGDKNIIPDDDTKTEIQHATPKRSAARIVGAFKLCLDTGGVVSRVVMLKSTGFSAYDAKIIREMEQWLYRPYLVNGKAVPVCTAVTFIYSQR